MTAMELIERVESAGGQLRLSGAKVVCRLPEDVDHALVELLRMQREAVARELRLREEHLGKGNSFDEIVRTWAAEYCVASMRCSANAQILYREFSTWAGFERNAAGEEGFLRQLADLGYRLHDGFVEGICLAEDFLAALEYENRRCGCDERECLETTSRETYQHQSRQRTETRESGGF